MKTTVLTALRAHALQQPDATALRGLSENGEPRVVSYASLLHQVDALATWLQQRQLPLLGLWGENQIEWVIADLAAWQAGMPLIPLPRFFSPAQLAFVAESSGLRHLLTCGAISDGLPTQGRVPSPVPAIHLDHLSAEAPAAPISIPPGTRKITFTSGTTGQPKGVCLSSATLDAVTVALAERIHASEASENPLTDHFCLLPLSTLLENVAGIYVPILLGKTAIVLPGPAIGLLGSSQLDLPLLLKTLHHHQPNSLIVLPQILAGLVAAANHGLPSPRSLRFVAVGGATTSPALLNQAHRLGIPVFEGYGLSECASVVSLNSPRANRVGSVGRALSHLRVRVVDGVIQVAGNAFSGYLGQPTSNPNTSWIDTGDIGHIDEQGYLHITGRQKNLLISSFGRNISPEWLEAELLLSPAIAQVMVIGDAQPFCAAVLVPRSSNADPSELASQVASVNATLPDYARIRRCIVASEPFSLADGSLTDNGRLRRDVIAGRHAAAIAALYSPTFELADQAVDPTIHPSIESGVLHAIF
ncbi:MAG: AMP-binding protein [Pseudomarimonas sp.]